MPTPIARRSGLVMLALAIAPTFAVADSPRYSFVGLSYEWNDVKNGIGTNNDILNNGDVRGVNLDGSLGLTGYAHIAGQYFDGTCERCFALTDGAGQTITRDLDFTGYKVGAGLNPTLSFIGDGNTDLIVRANYVRAELDNDLASVSTDGWSAEVHLRAQVSDRAEVSAGYEHFDLDDTTDNVVLGFGYEIVSGLTFFSNATVFNNESGFSLGVRWYFGDTLFGGRDGVLQR